MQTATPSLPCAAARLCGMRHVNKLGRRVTDWCVAAFRRAFGRSLRVSTEAQSNSAALRRNRGLEQGQLKPPRAAGKGIAAFGIHGRVDWWGVLSE